MHRCVGTFLILAAILAPLLRTEAQAQSTEPAPPLTRPTVTFSFELERARPAYFAITVDAKGQAIYESRESLFPDSPDQAEEPFVSRFAVSEATREQIFSAARALNYFQGDFDYHKRRIAFMGKKTLVWNGPEGTFRTSYNWSENGHVDDLTALFHRISNTQEFGRRLAFLRQFDKLGLEGELKSMEEVARDGKFGLAELQVLEPLLRSLASDRAVMHIARQRAQRLLNRASGGAEATPSASDRSPQ